MQCTETEGATLDGKVFKKVLHFSDNCDIIQNVDCWKYT